MKKAILIGGIIWMILCLAGGIFEIVFGIGDLMKITGENIELDPNIALGVANILVGVWLLAGAVFSLVDVLKRNSNMGKGAGIALGVVSLVFAAELPGVLFIIDSAKNRE